MESWKRQAALAIILKWQLHMCKFKDGDTIYVEMESRKRVLSMVKQMADENFGHSSRTGACEVECPQQISVLNIARMNWEYSLSSVLKK